VKFRLSAGLGDEVALTGLLREIKSVDHDEMIVVEDLRYPEILKGNPYVGWGNKENGRTVKLDPMAKGPGSIPHLYANQAGYEIADDTPEIFLDLDERNTATETAFALRRIGQPLVAVDWRAAWPSRRWPIERWRSLAEKLKGKCVTVEVGVSKGVDVYRTDLIDRVGADYSYVDQWRIRETAAFLSECDLFVGNDSGLMHLAASVKTPQVAIFSVKPWHTRAYRTTLPVFRYKPCNVTCEEYCRSLEGFCMNEIPVDRVERAILSAVRP
jgi:heptosyltransferase-2